MKIDMHGTDTFLARFPSIVINEILPGTLNSLAGGYWAQSKKDMTKNLDRPVPYTLGGVRYTKAKADDPQVKIDFKPLSEVSKGGAVAQYLQPSVEGVGRSHKPFEGALIAKGIMRRDQYAVPVGKYPKDAYGNVGPKVMNTIIADVGLSRGGVVKQTNLTKTRKSRRNYFFANKTGIYETFGGEKWKVFNFTKQPRYEKRYDFYALGKKYFDENFEEKFESLYGKRSWD